MTRALHRYGGPLLVLSALVMLALGLVMLYSTSAYVTGREALASGPEGFLRKQLFMLGVGLAAAVPLAYMDYRRYARWWWVLWLVAAVLLALCYVHGIGLRLNGASRWVRLGPVQFQPSELGKLAVVLGLAAWLSRPDVQAREFLRGMLLPCLGAGALMALIAFEKDLGTTALLGFTLVVMLWVAGCHAFWPASLAVGGLAGLAGAVWMLPERRGRILAFLDLEKFRQGAGAQQYQGLLALGSGGWEGLGLGNGRQKIQYLTYAHTDFIMPVVGEELGLRTLLLMVLCLAVMAASGFAVALRARDRLGLLLAAGATTVLVTQAVVNLGVTSCLLPNKGRPMPFVSYGGSNLGCALVCIGIVFGVWRQAVKPVDDAPGAPA